MLTHLGLRPRIFLFFCLMATGGAVLAAVALFFGWSRAEENLATGPFLTALVIFVFLNTGLLAAIWLLFDENLAKPIEKLASDLRLRAHPGLDREVDVEAARYLGDLAPAVRAASKTMSRGLLDSAEQVARETERLRSETSRLTALLTEIPVAIILLNPAFEIVVYDGQAAEVLTRIAPPRLKAPLTDYFDPESLTEARRILAETGGEASVRLEDLGRTLAFDARIKPLGANGYILTIDGDTLGLSPGSPRPLVYDFDLLETAAAADISSARLRDLCLVAFDTETTGLSPQTDDVVQIGAVRILNGRIVNGEIFDTYVDPGRPIPPASTRIHGVTDDDVAGAPDFVSAGRKLHHFCRDAVLVAHNAPFDIAFLKRFEAEMGVAWTHPVLDTVLLSAVLFGTTGDHALDALCDRLAIPVRPASRHTALGDARMTAEALVRMIPLLEAQGHATFGAVISETRRHGRLLQDLNEKPRAP